MLRIDVVQFTGATNMNKRLNQKRRGKNMPVKSVRRTHTTPSGVVYMEPNPRAVGKYPDLRNWVPCEQTRHKEK